MFNIYINDLFCFLTCDICNFADDTTPYVCNSSLEYVLEKLEQYSALAIEWFEINEMTMNAEKAIYLLQVINLNKCGLELKTIRYGEIELLNY